MEIYEEGTQSQDNAISIEHTMEREFNLGLIEFNKITSSDAIREDPYWWMVVCLMNRYNKSNDEIRNKIRMFINEYNDISKLSIDKIGCKKFEKIKETFDDIMENK